ncbi:MAG: hypothetical protein JW894_11975 [Bacteroidales bacterium]|nr:hypothetical protein [Bacteroidales bacterium]
MKKKIKKNLISITLAVIGLMGGYLYWRFIGCSSGTCPITSNWYSSTFLGGLTGYLLGDSISDLLHRKQKHERTLE